MWKVLDLQKFKRPGLTNDTAQVSFGNGRAVQIYLGI
jgi:hypothetical protein